MAKRESTAHIRNYLQRQLKNNTSLVIIANSVHTKRRCLPSFETGREERERDEMTRTIQIYYKWMRHFCLFFLWLGFGLCVRARCGQWTTISTIYIRMCVVCILRQFVEGSSADEPCLHLFSIRNKFKIICSTALSISSRKFHCPFKLVLVHANALPKQIIKCTNRFNFVVLIHFYGDWSLSPHFSKETFNHNRCMQRQHFHYQWIGPYSESTTQKN